MMTEKMDLRRAKVRLLDLAHDLELADMPTEADALRCMARGPTFTERDREVKEPEPKRNCPITRGDNFDTCRHCGQVWGSASQMKGCPAPPIQPATSNVPRNVPDRGLFAGSHVYTNGNIRGGLGT